MATELATLYYALVPTTKGIKGQLDRELVGPTDTAGKTAGTRFGTGFTGASKGGFANVGKAITGLGVLAGVGALKAAQGYSNVAKETAKLQRTLGGSVEDASRWRFAAAQAGLKADDFARSVGFLSKNIASGKLDKLGIDARNANGTMKPLGDVIATVADKFAGMENGAAKNALALQVFGRAGLQLLPFLNRGSAGLADLRKKADELGVTLNEGDLDAMRKNVAQTREFKSALEGLEVKLGQGVLPIMTKAASVGESVASAFGHQGKGAIQAETGILVAALAYKKVVSPLSNYVTNLGKSVTAMRTGATASKGLATATATATTADEAAEAAEVRLITAREAQATAAGTLESENLLLAGTQATGTGAAEALAVAEAEVTAAEEAQVVAAEAAAVAQGELAAATTATAASGTGLTAMLAGLNPVTLAIVGAALVGAKVISDTQKRTKAALADWRDDIGRAKTPMQQLEADVTDLAKANDKSNHSFGIGGLSAFAIGSGAYKDAQDQIKATKGDIVKLGKEALKTGTAQEIAALKAQGAYKHTPLFEVWTAEAKAKLPPIKKAVHGLGDEAVSMADRASKAWKDYTTMLGQDPGIAQASTDFRKNFDATDETQADLNVVASVQGMGATITQNGNNFDIATKKGRENRQSVIDAKNAMLDYVDALIKTGKYTGGEIKDKFQIMIAQFDASLKAAGATTDQITALNTEMGLTDPHVDIAFNTHGYDSAIKYFKNVNEQFAIALVLATAAERYREGLAHAPPGYYVSPDDGVTLIKLPSKTGSNKNTDDIPTIVRDKGSGGGNPGAGTKPPPPPPPPPPKPPTPKPDKTHVARLQIEPPTRPVPPAPEPPAPKPVALPAVNVVVKPTPTPQTPAPEPPPAPKPVALPAVNVMVKPTPTPTPQTPARVVVEVKAPEARPVLKAAPQTPVRPPQGKRASVAKPPASEPFRPAKRPPSKALPTGVYWVTPDGELYGPNDLSDMPKGAHLVSPEAAKLTEVRNAAEADPAVAAFFRMMRGASDQLKAYMAKVAASRLSQPVPASVAKTRIQPADRPHVAVKVAAPNVAVHFPREARALAPEQSNRGGQMGRGLSLTQNIYASDPDEAGRRAVERMRRAVPVGTGIN